MINSKSPSRFWPFFSTLLIVFLTDSLLFSTSDIVVLNIAKKVVPIVLAVVLFFLTYGKYKISIPLFLISISIIVSMILGIGAVSKGATYIVQISLLVFAYEYSKTVSFEDFSNSFIIIMRIIAIVSLVAFFMRSILVNLSFIPTIHTGGTLYYKTLFFTNLPINNSYGRRNFGPFWEPGAFQLYLNIALLFTVMRGKRFWAFDTALFVATAVTTFSGAALVPMPFVLLAAFLKNEKLKSKLRVLLFCIVLCIGMVYLFRYGVLAPIVDKLQGTNNDSYSVRLGSLLGNLKATLINPFFGVNPDRQYQLRGIETELLSGIYYEGNTNTFTGLFASFGVFVGAYYIYRSYMFTKNFSNMTIVRILVFVSIFLATSNEEFGQSIMFHTLLFIGGYPHLKKQQAIRETPNCDCAISNEQL